MKMCRYCATEIPDPALVCRFCGRSQRGAIWAQWMGPPITWVAILVAFIASAAFGMGVVSLLVIRSLMIAEGSPPFGFRDAPAPLFSAPDSTFDAVVERRREWRDGEEAPPLDRSEQPLGLDLPRRVEVDRDRATQLVWNVAAGATYTIAAEGIGGFDPYLYLFRVGDDGTLGLVSSDDDSGEGVNALISQTLVPGQYVVVVEGFDGGGGQCDVQVSREG